VASDDLAQAVLAQLRATPAVATAFGDTWNPVTETGTPKFFFDWAGQPDEPYLTAIEAFESYEFNTRTPTGAVSFIATGQLQVLLYASNRQTARALGVLVSLALNDQTTAIDWANAQVMNFRINRAEFASITVTGPNVPIAFNRILTFDYQYSSLIGEP
jgi:hypothetical protein